MQFPRQAKIHFRFLFSLVFSNSEVYTYFNVQRELTLVDGKTFARASFSLSFANPNSGFEIFQVEIDINEIHPFGEQGKIIDQSIDLLILTRHFI